MNEKFNIGDVVEVKDWGKRFSGYIDWFDFNMNNGSISDLDLKYIALFQVEGEVKNPNAKYEILAIGSHENSIYCDEDIVLIRQADAEEYVGDLYPCPTYLIGTKGLKPKTMQVSIEEAREIVARYYGVDTETIKFM